MKSPEQAQALILTAVFVWFAVKCLLWPRDYQVTLTEVDCD